MTFMLGSYKMLRSLAISAQMPWNHETSDFLKEDTEFDTYLSNHRSYRLSLHTFLNQLESDRAQKLCIAVETDEKLFQKLLKGQKSSSQIRAFVVNGKLS